MATIRLTAAAPTGGATVTLSSSNTDLARVPATVSIAAGSTSTTINIDVPSVPSNTDVTVTASYSSVTKTGTFTVTPPPLQARFTVVSRSKGANACAIDEDDGHIDCDFDARSSTGSVAEFQWTLKINDEKYEKNTADPVTSLSPSCGFLDSGTLGDDETVKMTVELNVVARNGERSSSASREVKLYPQKNCGY